MKLSILRQKAEPFCSRLFNGLCLLLFAFLFCSSLTSSWLNHEVDDEFVYYQKDSLFGNLLLLILTLAGLTLLAHLLQKLVCRPRMNLLALGASALAIGISLYWVQSSGTYPRADQEFIWEQAQLFNAGDFSGLQPGGYVAIYQQQLGIITVLRILDWIAPFFHTQGWYLFQLFSALTTGVLVYAGFRIVALLTHDQRTAGLLYLLLALVCAPMYLYTSFVYGESSSTAFSMLAAWMFLEYRKTPRVSCLIGLYFSTALALLLRTNTIIVFIAFAIVVVIQLLRKATRHQAVIGLALLLAMLTPTALTQTLYGDKIPEESKTMPAILFIAMGTNDDVPNAGWYNSYSYLLYQDCDYDPQSAYPEARGYLVSFWARCREDPAYAVDFYNRKISSQWNAPMYQCIFMNSRVEGPQTALVQDLYQGEGNRRLTDFMNFYQSLIYGGVLVFTIFALKRRVSLEQDLLLIAVFGGFLFSVLWEAKARYVFPYFLLMIPCAAVGISALITGFRRRFIRTA
ncbi:hypothetical protein [Subdoligranulum variabile]|uniref:Glycosyltransferase RgtA/B/C/D-like domain-containing protein n=1 Tax=Subdoligranulum variabile DSM 15176 TaxID=411471 RepID=D1PPZ2_9FIRM|nr:hypothetical protein [Subdoligranulum variabile]EFB75337.1 hypothetical protein SUBVAR_06458 [Subdoligranulum variabile DSM 15176]UWP69233.1 hypothetical protein NQ490_05105 [Subdoligranulum variabile]